MKGFVMDDKENDTPPDLDKEFRKRAMEKAREQKEHDERRKLDSDDSGGREPYGHHQGRFIGDDFDRER